MILLRFSKYILIFAIPFLLITSCNEGCNSQLTPNRQVKLTFSKRSAGNVFSDSVVSSIILYSNDTFYRGVPAQKVSLELNQNADSSWFFLKTDSLKSPIIDSFLFSYKKELVFLSSECGFNTSFSKFKLEKYTRHKIDTVIVQTEDINSEVPFNYRVVMKKDTTRRR